MAAVRGVHSGRGIGAPPLGASLSPAHDERPIEEGASFERHGAANRRNNTVRGAQRCWRDPRLTMPASSNKSRLLRDKNSGEGFILVRMGLTAGRLVVDANILAAGSPLWLP